MRTFGKLSSTFFFSNVKIYKNEAYVSHELLKDVFIISETHWLDETAIKCTVDLKRKLIKKLDESISFFPSGKYVIVHSSDTNPCQYGIAFLQGSGLRDDDIVKSFGRLIKRKVCKRNEESIGLPPVT